MLVKDNTYYVSELIAQVYDNKQEVAILINAQFEIEYFNQYAKKFYDKLDLQLNKGELIKNLFPEKYQENFINLIDSVFDGKEKTFNHTIIVDGLNLLHKVNLTPIESKKNNQNFVLLNFRLIEETLENEVLEENKLFLSTINQLLPAYIFIYDVNTKQLIYSNQCFSFHLDYNFSDEKRRKVGSEVFSGLLKQSDKLLFLDNVRNIQKNRDLSEFEIELNFKNAKNQNLYFLSKQVVFKRVEGEVSQILGIATNITEKKKYELEIIEFNKSKVQEKEKINKLKSIALLQGQEKERRRLAQDLHDSIGQMLFATKMKLNQAIGNIQIKDNTESEELIEVKNLISQTINEIRRVSHDLMPNVLYDFGFQAAVNKLIDNFKKSNDKIKLNLQISNELQDKTIDKVLKDAVALALYRILQEGLNNAYKYSKANTIEVNISLNLIEVKLSIKDDGIGFKSSEKLKYNSNQPTGNGLNNIKERVKLLNGNFTVFSQPNEGVLLIIKLPINQK